MSNTLLTSDGEITVAEGAHYCNWLAGDHTWPALKSYLKGILLDFIIGEDTVIYNAGISQDRSVLHLKVKGALHISSSQNIEITRRVL